MISAIILTLNEEINIVDCINTLKTWCSDIVVFDSFSSDKTVELAKANGARVFQRKFDNYAAQRNAALKEVDYTNEWVVMVDADERFDTIIGEMMLKAIQDSQYPDTSIFHFQRKDIFLGRWLKHNIGAKTWFGRLLKIDDVWIERDINEEYHCNGNKSFIKNCSFLHYPFSNGVNWWFARHNRYSDMEAIRLMDERSDKLNLPNLLGREPIARRKALKQLIYRIPCRPLLMFFALYIVKLGFLDGRAGFHYSILRSIYEYMIDLKILENREKTT